MRTITIPTGSDISRSLQSLITVPHMSSIPNLERMNSAIIGGVEVLLERASGLFNIRSENETGFDSRNLSDRFVLSELARR
jgi:hypothetical protein